MEVTVSAFIILAFPLVVGSQLLTNLPVVAFDGLECLVEDARCQESWRHTY